MAERIRDRGPDGAGGWLESACKLIISVRAGILLVTLLSLPDQDERTAAIVAIVVAGAASFVPLRFWAGSARARAPSGLLRRRARADDRDPAAHGRRQPVRLLRAGDGAARRAALRPPRRRAVRPAAGRRLLLGARPRDGPLPDAFQDLVGQPALYLVAAAAGAAARRLLDRQAEAEAGAVRAGAPARRRGGAGAARARHARLARQDRVGHRLRGARALAPDRARPGGRGVEARRLAEDARQATRQAREIIVGLRADAGESLPLSESRRRAGAALGRGHGRRARPRGRGRRRAASRHRPRAGVDRPGGAGERLAPRARHPRRGAHAAARRPRGAHRDRRRRRLRGARRARRARRRAPLRRRRHARAGAARRRRPQRRVGARRGLRALGLGADRDRAARDRPAGARRAPAADPDGNLPGRSVPGYTWQ